MLFFFKKVRHPLLLFYQGCIKHRKVNVAPVEGIVMIGKLVIAVLRKAEMSQVPFRHRFLPVKGIGFMIAYSRSYRNLVNRISDCLEPCLPLIFILAVIYDISKIDKESGIRILDAASLNNFSQSE